ncbi:DUF1624 domain-containing protein [Aureimonas leprariae]|uniref:DUF1624 domain-containing protein n=2 Tax=Plantimonas leprariae TaxID=2615207 RepID=A0A7V7PL79_9HYPH|nr:DUF1624 domain-containing protein [Aureimonas leprariae]
MASYHFTWDLDANGYVRQGLANTGPWKIYARCIATSFLFLVGISLVLAHGRGIRWRSFWIREAQVAAGALAVTVATFFLMPGGFIFFGILHQIALASLIGLLFLRLPPLLTLGAGIGAIALPFLVQTTLTEPKWLAWIGLAARAPVSNDYVPIFPWTGIVLLGIATGRLLDRFGAWRRLASLNEPLRRFRPFAALGRHSLLFYLIHQPLLFGLVAGAAYVFPPDRTVAFTADCLTECRADEAICRQACACVGDRLKAEQLLAALMERRLSGAQTERLDGIVRECRLPLATP